MFTFADDPRGLTPSIQKALITGVDTNRKMAEMKTSTGLTINARWLGDSPQEQDTCLVAKIGREFYILGSFEIPTSSDSYRPGPSISSQGIDDLNFTGMMVPGGSTGSAPGDQKPGDKVMSSIGGGLLAALRAGTVVAKASQLSQLILSPFSNMGRLVTENWEHFTGFDSTWKVSKGGAVYKISEFYSSPGEASSGKPTQRVFEGNLGAAGAKNGSALRQTVTYDSSGVETNVASDFRDGSQHRIIQNGGSSVEISSSINSHSVKVNGGDTSSIDLGERDLTLKVGSTTIRITKDSATIEVGGGSSVSVTKDKLQFSSPGDTEFSCQNLKFMARGSIDFG